MGQHILNQISLVCQLLLIIDFVQNPNWLIGSFLFLIFYDVIKDIILDIKTFTTKYI
jgi:hypothetical protein